MDTLTAVEVIAVNQDPLGVAGDLVWKQGPAEVLHFALLALLCKQMAGTSSGMRSDAHAGVCSTSPGWLACSGAV